MSDGAGGSSTAAPRALPGRMADATQTASAGTAAAAPSHKAMGPSADDSAQQLPQTTSASGSERPRLAGAGMQRALSGPNRPAAANLQPPARPVAPRRPGGGRGVPPAPQAASNVIASARAPASLAPVAAPQQRLPAAESGGPCRPFNVPVMTQRPVWLLMRAQAHACIILRLTLLHACEPGGYASCRALAVARSTQEGRRLWLRGAAGAAEGAPAAHCRPYAACAAVRPATSRRPAARRRRQVPQHASKARCCRLGNL